MKKKKYVKPELMEYSIMPCAPLAASQDKATGTTEALNEEDGEVSWGISTESED